MGSEYGKNVRISIFGESHSAGIGVVLDGIPAGEKISLDSVQEFMARRAPGQGAHTTRRKEADIPEILSGLVDNVTCGTPIAAVIRNIDTRSSDYERDIPRPSHADYPAYMKYGNAHDIRGGGHFSGRLTAGLCFAGAVCKQILLREGITIGARIASVGMVKAERFDPVSDELKDIPLGDEILDAIEAARVEGDSVGGTIECCALGLSAGIGEPIFDGIESKISQIVFGIPAVKGIEFGSGFSGSELRGSENNDSYYYDGDTVRTRTNNNGGIAGGLSTSMPLIYRVAIKPTASISKEQDSISLSKKTEEKINIKGRHDPCIVPRAVPCVEAATAIALLDLIYEGRK